MEECPVNHYPSSHRKYTGTIFRYVSKRGTEYFRALFRSPVFSFSKTFRTEALAFECIKQNNIKHGLPIKNMMKEYEEYMEVNIGHNIWAKFDKEDLGVVENHTFHNCGGYAVCCIEGKTVHLHNILLDHIPKKGNEITVDHRNRDRLDNRRENLRLATQSMQHINKGVKKSNKSGTTGVRLIKQTPSAMRKNKSAVWAAEWYDDEGKDRTKSFSIAKYGDERAKEMAIAHRKLIEETVERYKVALK